MFENVRKITHKIKYAAKVLDWGANCLSTFPKYEEFRPNVQDTKPVERRAAEVPSDSKSNVTKDELQQASGVLVPSGQDGNS